MVADGAQCLLLVAERHPEQDRIAVEARVGRLRERLSVLRRSHSASTSCNGAAHSFENSKISFEIFESSESFAKFSDFGEPAARAKLGSTPDRGFGAPRKNSKNSSENCRTSEIQNAKTQFRAASHSSYSAHASTTKGNVTEAAIPQKRPHASALANSSSDCGRTAFSSFAKDALDTAYSG